MAFLTAARYRRYIVKNCFFILLILTPLVVFSQIKPDGYFTDRTEQFTSLEDEIEEMCTKLEQENGCELAVLIVRSSSSEVGIDYYAELVFNSWGIGKPGKNNGVLFILATRERQARIEVGSGLETILTDDQAHNILMEYAIPYFKEDNWEEGIIKTTRAIINFLSTHYDSNTEDVKQDIYYYFNMIFNFLLVNLQTILVIGFIIINRILLIRKKLITGKILLIQLLLIIITIIIGFITGIYSSYLYNILVTLGGVGIFIVQYFLSQKHLCPKCRGYMNIYNIILEHPSYSKSGRKKI
jgi:uncharacterized membrane protein YgcG